MNPKKYNNIKLAIGITETILTFLLLLAFIVFGFSDRLALEIQKLIANPYGQFILFAFILGAALFVIFLPFSYYSEFTLEHKYNLSNQSVGQWLKETFKGIFVSTIILLPVLLVFWYLFNYSPNYWWLYFSLVMFFFSVLLAKIAPVVILPLFYKIIPSEDELLISKIKELGKRAGLKVENVYKFDMSKNTKKANAAFTGLGKTKRIILGDTLLENFSNEEIETVLAHEMGHYKKKHIIKNIIISTVSSFAVFYLIYFFYNISYQYLGFEQYNDVAATPLLALWGMIIGLITTPLSNMLSRKFEYEADEYAVSETNKPDVFIKTLEKLNEQNLGDKEPHPLVEWFFYSHPSIKKRIEYISTIKKEKNYEN